MRASGAAELVPAILGGFKKLVQSDLAGLEGLAGPLGRLDGDSNPRGRHFADGRQGNAVTTPPLAFSFGRFAVLA